MSGILMMIIAIVVLGGAYLLYGRYLQNKWGIDPNAKTPAYELEDGVDYSGSNLRMASGSLMDFNWWCILRSSSGFRIYVCICKEQRPYNWLHH